MRRVLMVTSAYRPAMIADMHRVRHLAWELPRHGWDAEVLAPDPRYQHHDCLDDDSDDFFASHIPVHTARVRFDAVFKSIGVSSVGWRALWPMYRAGSRLLATGRFDAVYISTTQFPLFALGWLWRKRRGVPYVLDLHDPWYREQTTRPSWLRSGWKHRAGRWLARHLERLTVRNAAGIVSVSADYIATLRQRHGACPWSVQGRHETVPFAFMAHDFEAAAGGERIHRPAGIALRVAYVGAGAPVMSRSLEVLCGAIAHVKREAPELLAGVRFDLMGTFYRWVEGDRKASQEIADRHAVGDLVVEDPRRVTYRRSLARLAEADGALILGVDDGAYMPSKLFSYAASGKPLLAVLRRDGPAFAQLARPETRARCMWFDRERDMPVPEAAAVLREFLREARARVAFDRRDALSAFTSVEMARRHARLFEASVSP